MNPRKILRDFAAGKPLQCVDCGGVAKALWQTLSGPQPICAPCGIARGKPT